MSIPVAPNRTYSEIESNLIDYSQNEGVYALNLDPKLTPEKLEVYHQHADSLGLIVKFLGFVWDLRLNLPPVEDKETYQQVKKQLGIDRTVILNNIYEGTFTCSDWFDVLCAVDEEPDQEEFTTLING